jgi:tryptophan 2,3-dioxygenase
MYHQVTELYFKMILMEVNQIVEANPLTVEEFTMRISRVNRYVNILVESFAVMYDGMEQEQFLKFRMSLLPASGFQSVQFRTIEIASTDFNNLLNPEGKAIESTDWAERFKHIYWLQGATELASGRKTYTLVQFEKKYGAKLIEKAKDYDHSNLAKKIGELVANGAATEELITRVKKYDVLVNITWRLMHLRSAVQYLHKEPAAIAATGGTNWQDYLPPKFQKRSFFPELWSEAEMQEWGKDWVKDTLAKIRKEA